MKLLFPFRLALMPVLIGALAAGGCAVNPVTGERELVFMSEDQEIAMGREYHPQILRQYGAYENPELQSYVERVGRALAAESHRDDLIFRFTVLDSPEVNAFALPGGYIYITRGIMAYINSEAQLAGILGHEIGHVTHRHAVQRHTASTMAGILTTWVAFETGSQTYTDLSQILGGALISGYGRSQELEADARGAEYLARVGYDTDAMIDVIGILKDQEVFARQRAENEGRESPGYHGVFATHPENDTRLKEAIRAAKEFQAPVQKADNAERYLKAVNGMIYGQNPDQGVIRGGSFYHAKLDIAFAIPEKWYTQNQADRFLMAAPDQAAIMQLTVEDLNKKQTPVEYLNERLNNPEARQSRSIKTAGMAGHTLVTETRTSFGYNPTRFTVVFKDNRAYLFTATVKEPAQFERYDDAFRKTAESFHRMSAAEHKNAKPYRIELYTAQRGDTYAKLAGRSPLPEYREEWLRVINGQYPDGKLSPGRLIKIVQ